MELGETYLKEFWKFTYFEKTTEEIGMLGNIDGTWYRAALATNFLKNNGLIEEVEFKKYRITKLGRKLVTNNKYYNNKDIDIMYILEKVRKINLLGTDYILTDNFEKENFIDSNYIPEIEKVNRREIEISTLEIPKNIKANCKIKKYKKKIGERTKVTVNKKISNKNKIEISDKFKSMLGIEGEKYVYKNLILNNEYKCNIENQDKYFIIKVNNFKYIKNDESKINVTIIKNPYKIFMENTDILKTITFF